MCYLAHETVSCILCGREHNIKSDTIAKIHHPTKPLTTAYACRSHQGINEEHARCYPEEAKIFAEEVLEKAQETEAETDQIINMEVSDV